MSPGATDASAPLAPEDSRRYTRDVELYYGQTGLLMDKWERWFEQLTHGKPLAWLIGVASVGVAVGFFYVAATSKKGTQDHYSSFSRTPPPGGSQTSSPSNGVNPPV